MSDIRQGRNDRKRQKSEIRLHTIVAADRIVILNNGEIVQTGTHRELITQKGLYADMWRKQQLAAGWKPVGDPQ